LHHQKIIKKTDHEKKLTAEDAAQEHCHVGATDFTTALVMDRVEDTLA
jgi:hypothetical protein